MFRFYCFGLLCMIGMASSAGADTVIRSNKAIRDIPVMRQGDSTRYDPALCADYLIVESHHHHRFQSGVGHDGQQITAADLDSVDILGDSTAMMFQPSPATQNKTSKITETNTQDNVTTTTDTLRTQNAAAVASATPIAVHLDHKSGLLFINGKILSEFEKRQLQESCRDAIQR